MDTTTDNSDSISSPTENTNVNWDDWAEVVDLLFDKTFPVYDDTDIAERVLASGLHSLSQGNGNGSPVIIRVQTPMSSFLPISIEAKHAILLHDEAALNATLRCIYMAPGYVADDRERTMQIFCILIQRLDVLKQENPNCINCPTTAFHAVETTKKRIEVKRKTLNTLLGDVSTEDFVAFVMQRTEPQTNGQEILPQGAWCAKSVTKI